MDTYQVTIEAHIEIGDTNRELPDILRSATLKDNLKIMDIDDLRWHDDHHAVANIALAVPMEDTEDVDDMEAYIKEALTGDTFRIFRGTMYVAKIYEIIQIETEVY